MAWTTKTLLTAIGAAPVGHCFTEADMVRASGLTATQIESASYNLRKHGFITRSARGCHQLTAAGRAALDGGTNLKSGPKGPQETGQRRRKSGLRQRVWNCLRMGKKVTIDDIVMRVVDGDERDPSSNVGKYLRALSRAGYVRAMPLREVPASGYRNKGTIRWLLAQDTGPQAPAWRATRNAIYDPNIDSEIKFADVATEGGQ